MLGRSKSVWLATDGGRPQSQVWSYVKAILEGSTAKDTPALRKALTGV